MKHLLTFLATLLTAVSAFGQNKEVVFLPNSGANVSVHVVDPNTGILSQMSGSPFPNSGGPSIRFALHPSKKFLYVATNGPSSTISIFAIDSAGALQMLGSPVTLNPPPPSPDFYLGMDPKGRFLYAATVTGWPNNVYGWAIDQNTAGLAPIPGMPVTAGSFSDSHAFCVTVDPAGRFAYVCNQDDGTVSSFVIDQTTGALTNAQQTQSGLRPRSVSVEPTGRFAYVVNYGVNPPNICQGTYAHGTGQGCVVRAFSIDQTTGVLNSIGANDMVSTGTNPIWSTIDPAGRVLYTVNINSNDISAFSISGTTGTLTPIGSYPAGQGPISINVDPSGKFAYVPNVFDGSTYSYARDAAGALSLTGVTPGFSPNDVAAVAPFADQDSGLAQLNGGNTFTGNQTVSGNVMATSFVGNGAGLTGVNASSLGGIASSNYARLDIGNTFNGNQTVNGSVTASALSGSGSGLTNLSPANIGIGTANINITGAAASAASAANATNLGGIAAGSYARLDIGNIFNGNQAVSGNLSVSGNSTTAGSVSIGSGTAITKHLSILVNPSIPLLKPLSCTYQNFALPGGADGDTLALGIPNARMQGGGILVYIAWVSAADTITLRSCNVDANNPQKIAGSGMIRIDLWKH